jgi:MOSC domain-containing protein YiiM
MKILAVCIGEARTLPGKSYKTGIFKRPVDVPVFVDSEGIVGDAICNRKHHGGVDQAIYVEGSLTLDWWSRELGRMIEPGTFGENLVVEGLDNTTVSVGDRFHVADAVLEVTSARIPCATFAARMDDPMFVKRYTKAGRPGIYCRVITGGVISPGEAVGYQPFSGEKVLMPEMMATYGKPLGADDRRRFLAAPIHHKLKAKLEAA